MDRLTCDRCDEGLYHDIDVRYEVRIEVKSGYDVMELTGDDLAGDASEEMRRLIERAGRMSAEELADQVYKLFEFDLCATCQRAFLADPLGRQGR